MYNAQSSIRAGESLGSDKLVAATYKFRNFVPVDFTYIQPESNPSFRSNVSGQIESLGLGAGESFVITRQNLTRHGNYAISVMVVEKISKCLFAH